ncbi:MAG: fibronectin type III domain-containing protein, partial [Candidatus Oxydemutatoraceae bacterium WSBS_2016_MAG_OTU14]
MSIAPNVQAQITQLPEPTEVTGRASDNTVVVEWASVPNNVTSYVLTLTHDTEEAREEIVMISSDRMGNHIFDNLTHASDYELSVVAQGDSTQNSDSAPYTIAVMTEQAQLSAPATVTARANNRIEMTVTWDNVENATGYEVALYATYSDPLITETIEVGKVSLSLGMSDDLTHTFEMLHGLTDYRASVVATAEGYRDSEETNAFRTTGPQFFAIEKDFVTLEATTSSITVNSALSCIPSGASGGNTTNVRGNYTFAPSASSIRTFTHTVTTDSATILKDLTPGTIYTFEVSRVCRFNTVDARGSFVSAGRDPLLGFQNPFRISIKTLELQQLSSPSVTVVVQNENDIAVTWTGTERATIYTVNLYDSTDGNKLVEAEEVSAPTMAYTFSDSTTRKTYIVGVVASANNYRNSEEARSGKIGIGIGTLVDVTTDQNITNAATTSSIRLSWNAENAPDNATHYVLGITGDTSVGSREPATVAISEMRYDFTGLNENTLYTISVIARNDTGLDNDSTTPFTINVTTLAKQTLPNVTGDQNITSTVIANSITLSWPTEDAPDNATHYVFGITGGASGADESVTVAVSDMSYNFIGLSVNTPYTISVIARGDTNLYNDSAIAFNIEKTTLKKQLADLSFFQGVSASAVTENSITLSWASGGLANATHYVLEISGGSSNAMEQVVAISEGSHEFINLDVDTLYTITVIARGDIDEYSDSAIPLRIQATTLQVQLATPIVSITMSGSALAVTWESVVNANRYFVFIDEIVNNAPVQVGFSNVSSPRTDYTFGDITLGKTYVARVSATGTGFANSEQGRSEEIEVQKQTLDNVTADQNITSSVTVDSITLSWPTEDAPDNATHYVLAISEGSSVVMEQVVAISEESYEFSDLNTNALYTITVIARGDNDFYDDSDTAFNIGSTTMIGQLADVNSSHGISATVVGNNIRLSWIAEDAPVNATHYVIGISEGSSVVMEQVVAISEESYEFSDLNTNTLYTITVIARADITRYNDSMIPFGIQATTLLMQLATPIVSITVSGLELAVTWESVANANRYFVFIDEIANNVARQVGFSNVSSPRTDYTFSNIMLGKTYVARVTAFGTGFPNSDEGRSDNIVIVEKQTLESVTTGQNIASTVIANSITLSWPTEDAPDNATHYVFAISGGASDAAEPVAVAIDDETYEFTGLESNTAYTIMVTARGDEARYNDSENAFGIQATTPMEEQEQLDTPTVSANASGFNIDVSWTNITQATTYTVNLYVSSDGE